MASQDGHPHATFFETDIQLDFLFELPGMTAEIVAYIRRQEQYFTENAAPFDQVRVFFCYPRQDPRLFDFLELNAQYIHPHEAIHARTQLAQWFLTELNLANIKQQQYGERWAILHPLMSYAYRFVDSQLREIAIGGRPPTLLGMFESGGLLYLDWQTRAMWIGGGAVSSLICLFAGDLVRIAVDAIYFMKRNSRAPVR
jgi:mannose-6-phosphate isomerase class I